MILKVHKKISKRILYKNLENKKWALKIIWSHFPVLVLEPPCCKKWQKRSLWRYWFREEGSSKGSEWYQIDPKWLVGHSCSFRTKLVSSRTFRRPLFPKLVSWQGLFATSYSKAALILNYSSINRVFLRPKKHVNDQIHNMIFFISLNRMKTLAVTWPPRSTDQIL